MPRSAAKGGLGSNQYEAREGSGLDDDASMSATADVAAGAMQFANGTADPKMEALQMAIEADVPVLIWGEPGIGKTAALRDLASSQDWEMETVIASRKEPADFDGYPTLGHDEDGEPELTAAAPKWAKKLMEKKIGEGRALVFLDEISTATPAVQAALLGVVQDRLVGEAKLGPGVRMVAAANPVESAAGGWDLAPPAANRFCHLDWTVNNEEVQMAFLTGRWPNPQPLTVPPDWEEGIPKARTRVGSFLSRRPALIQALPKEDSATSRGWPSPRSWDNASRALACCEASGASDNAKSKIMIGLVGEGPASEYLRWEKDMDLPDPKSILKNPGAYDMKDYEGDRAFAVCESVSSAVIDNPTPENWANGIKFMCSAVAAGKKDMAGVGVRMIMPSRPAGAAVPPEIKEFIPMLQASGQMPGGK